MDPPKTPVILIPGMIGSRLGDPRDGRCVWGTAPRFFLPRDGGYNMARPIHPRADWADDIEALGTITDLRLFGLFRIDVCQAMIDVLLQQGYRLGDLFRPRPGDTLFLFPYDLRYSNVRAARTLAERMEGLRRMRGDSELEVDLICHSNAAHIARYFIKFGGATLEQAERGHAAPAERLRVARLILVGSPNGGTMVAFRDLQRGVQYARFVGRRFLPETLFTFRLVFELLPVYRDTFFFDVKGRPMTIDLFDADNWRDYEWSVFAPEPRRRLHRQQYADVFGDTESRTAQLEKMLDRARRFHALLRRDDRAEVGTRYFLIHGTDCATPDGALLVETDGGWKTCFAQDRSVRRRPAVRQAVESTGDGVTTRDSLEWLAPRETAAIAGRLDTITVYHRWMLTSREAQTQILQWLRH